MPLKTLFFLFIVWTIAETTWSEEPSRRGPVKQRVPAKVLREAMLMQDNEPKTTQAAAAPDRSLQRLHQLAEKLRKNGNSEDADFLEQFSHEHRKLLAEISLHHSQNTEPVYVSLEAVEVDRAHLPAHSVLNDPNLASKTAEVRAELDRLVMSKKAKVLLHQTSLKTKWNQSATTHEGSDVKVPTTDGTTGLSQTTREFGTCISVLPVQVTNQQCQLEMTCELSRLNNNNTVEVNGAKVPGIDSRKVQCTLDLTTGESSIHSIPAGFHGTLVFVTAKIAPAK